jgi:hypothetical protein
MAERLISFASAHRLGIVDRTSLGGGRFNSYEERTSASRLDDNGVIA